jgi:glycosidase
MMKISRKKVSPLILSLMMVSMVIIPIINSIEMPALNVSQENQDVIYQNPIAQQGSLDNNVEWDYVLHDSRDGYYRSPGFGTTTGNQKSGAVLIGIDVIIGIRILSGDVSSVSLKIWDGPNQNQISLPMSISSSDSGYDYWETTIVSPSIPSDYYYHFAITDGTDTDYYSDDEGDGGIGTMYSDLNSNQDWGIIFYESSFETPTWHQNAVGYQIFPERFYNGDLTNDPIGDGSSGDIMWYAWDQNGNNIQDSFEVATYVNVNDWSDTTPGSSDFYGGDLKGVEDKVDYLADLGIDFIWFDPFSESPDNHGYSVDNYTSIDPYFGKIAYRQDGIVYNDYTGSLEVYTNMTSALLNHSIRPIYDAVINHVSAQSIFFQRFETDFGAPDVYPDIRGAYEYPPPGEYYNWFKFYNPPHDYDSWWGFDNIPTLMYEQSNGAIEEELITGENSIFTFWQEHEIGGFRLDVPNMYVDGENSFHINRQIRNVVKDNDPDDIIIGEIWGRANAWLTGTMHDGVQNMDLRDSIIHWINGLKSTDKFTNDLLYDQENYPSPAFYSQWTLLGNHDTTRALTDLADDKNRLKLAATIQFTYPGVPVIYYGDEVGLNGARDPGCRKPFPWGSEDMDLHAFYKTLIGLRKNYTVFRQGGFEIVDNNNLEVISYARELNHTGLESEVAITIVNRDDRTLAATFNLSNLEYLKSGDLIIDVFSGTNYTIPDTKQVIMTLEGQSTAIFMKTLPETPDDGDSNRKISGYSMRYLLFALFGIPAVLMLFPSKKLKLA